MPTSDKISAVVSTKLLSLLLSLGTSILKEFLIKENRGFINRTLFVTDLTKKTFFLGMHFKMNIYELLPMRHL